MMATCMKCNRDVRDHTTKCSICGDIEFVVRK